jgi:hypothetical protein
MGDNGFTFVIKLFQKPFFVTKTTKCSSNI